MKTPRVSVLIPTYNFARFLAEAIESVLQQDFQDYELIIVDDCSSDNSAQIIKQFAARDSRIHYKINSTNKGMVQNWNYCMDLARGSYLKYLFGDDKFADSRALGKLVSMLDNCPTAALAVSARNIIDENSKQVDTWDHIGDSGCYKGDETIVRCLSHSQNLIGEPSVVLFRKTQASRGFNVDYHQIVDLEMWFYLLEQGDLVYTNEPLCCFRKHPQQQTALNNASKVGQTERFQLWNECSSRPWIRKSFTVSERLSLVYSLRRVPETPQILAIKKNYLTDIGKLTVFLYWLGKKILRPYENLKRSIRKRMILWVFIFVSMHLEKITAVTLSA